MASYFITIDSGGAITELFSDAPGYIAPPPAAVQISDVDGELLRQNGFGKRKLTGGAVVVNVELLLAEALAVKDAEIEAAYSAAIAVIAAQYPDTERDSWPKQEAEARAYTANPSAATPLLSAIASRRGITVADLAARVIANADAYAVQGGDIIGRRQARMDAIAAAVAANDMAALAAVVW